MTWGRGRTAVGIREEDSYQRVGAPGILDHARPEAQRDDAWQRPQRLHHGHEGALVEPLGEPGDQQQGEDVDDGLQLPSAGRVKQY